MTAVRIDVSERQPHRIHPHPCRGAVVVSDDAAPTLGVVCVDTACLGVANGGWAPPYYYLI